MVLQLMLNTIMVYLPTGDDEGKLTNSTIENVAKDAGANLDKVKAEIKKDKLANHMKDNISNYTQSLGIQGTAFHGSCSS